MLGIRTAAMAIRTWTTTKALNETIVLAYSSLALAAEGIISGAEQQTFAVAIDARRKSWYGLSSRQSSGSLPEIQRVPAGKMDSFAFHSSPTLGVNDYVSPRRGAKLGQGPMSTRPSM